jgi:hypothetical protein
MSRASSPGRGCVALVSVVLLLSALEPALAHAEAPGPPQAGRSWVASVIYGTTARMQPNAQARPRGTVGAVSQWGTPTELLVLATSLDSEGNLWLKVRLDVRPNGAGVWLDARDTVLSSDPWRIAVSLAEREIRVYRAGQIVRRFAAVVGKPSTPTPSGLFAVAAELRQPDPQQFVGAWVLPLTAHSQVLTKFDGGDGQVALHGRGEESLADPLGSARSHGCVRIENAAIGWLATHVPVGTPVSIR